MFIYLQRLNRSVSDSITNTREMMENLKKTVNFMCLVSAERAVCGNLHFLEPSRGVVTASMR